ncbi:MAG: relaxase domain-containing protein [Actinomycetota bacterium]|nr:relaxase domain-containing protein [Actinomycetota bacterium]
MLTVAKVTSGQAAGYAEYLQGKAQAPELGDYHLREGERVEAPGRWAGGARAVGVDPESPVSSDQLRALMAVRRPGTGTALRRVGGSGEAVAAIDATFSAPKSVSAVWALGSPELRGRIERSHEQAIDRALSYAVEHAPMIRDRLDKQTVIHARPVEVIATSWRHTTARAVNDQPPDPQLHSHVLLHGAVRADGRVVAIDSRSWLVHRRELGAAYRTELARALTGLGFQVERGTGRGERYFELSGVPQALVDRWSSRHHQVRAAIDARLEAKETALMQDVASGRVGGEEGSARLAALRRSGRLAPAEDRLMAASTRAAKAGLATRGDLDRHWKETARSFAFDGRNVEQLHQATVVPLRCVEDRELLARLVEFDATFPDREARAVALESSVGMRAQDGLVTLDRLRSSGELLALADGTSTTRAHRAAEREIVMLADGLGAGRVAPIPAALTEGQALALDAKLRQQGAALAPEQHRALLLGCVDRQLVIIEGQAGSGKSTVLSAIALAHQSDGREIVVTSTAALAAQRLAGELADAGVDASAYSTAALDRAVRCGRLVLSPASTVIHDEAALASTREQRHLLQAIEASGARLIEVGDPRQSQAVGAGGLWPSLERAADANGARVELTRNVRAHDPADRHDQKLFRDGEHEQALKGYADRGRVVLAQDRRRAEDAALEAAHADGLTDKRTIVIAQTSNDHLDELNARAQAIRAENDELGQRSVPVPGRPYRLHPGDQIQLRRTLSHSAHGPLRNGQSANVTEVDEDRGGLVLGLNSGRTVALDEGQIARADLRLAYVQHPFPAQGLTSDTAHVIVIEHATAEGSYVALTRARESTRLYASGEQLDSESPESGRDQLQALAGQIGRSEPEVPSIHTPLAHEHAIATEHEETAMPPTREQHAISERDPGQPDHCRDQRPGEHVTAVLGPQPEPGNPNREAWDRASTAIERYRSRYEIDDPAALGREPPPGEFGQRWARREAAAEILGTLDRPVQQRGELEEQIRGGAGLTHEEPERDRTVGWEP